RHASAETEPVMNASQIPANRQTILTETVAQLMLEVALLALDETPVHDDQDEHQHEDPPPGVEGQREAEVHDGQTHVERVAREAVRARGDDRRAGKRWIDVGV